MLYQFLMKCREVTQLFLNSKVEVSKLRMKGEKFRKVCQGIEDKRRREERRKDNKSDEKGKVNLLPVKEQQEDRLKRLIFGGSADMYDPTNPNNGQDN